MGRRQRVLAPCMFGLDRVLDAGGLGRQLACDVWGGGGSAFVSLGV